MAEGDVAEGTGFLGGGDPADEDGEEVQVEEGAGEVGSGHILDQAGHEFDFLQSGFSLGERSEPC